MALLTTPRYKSRNFIVEIDDKRVLCSSCVIERTRNGDVIILTHAITEDDENVFETLWKKTASAMSNSPRAKIRIVTIHKGKNLAWRMPDARMVEHQTGPWNATVDKFLYEIGKFTGDIRRENADVELENIADIVIQELEEGQCYEDHCVHCGKIHTPCRVDTPQEES